MALFPLGVGGFRCVPPLTSLAWWWSPWHHYKISWTYPKIWGHLEFSTKMCNANDNCLNLIKLTLLPQISITSFLLNTEENIKIITFHWINYINSKLQTNLYSINLRYTKCTFLMTSVLVTLSYKTTKRFIALLSKSKHNVIGKHHLQ